MQRQFYRIDEDDIRDVTVTSNLLDQLSNRYLTVTSRFRETAFKTSICEYPQFFRALAETAAEVFDAGLAVVWDNNENAESLVLLQSHPEIKPTPYADTLRLHGTLTESAIRDRSLKVHGDILQKIGYARRTTYQNVLEGAFEYMVSVPATDSERQSVFFVLNLFFDKRAFSTFDPDSREVAWLSTSLGIALDYLSLRIDKHIRSEVDRLGGSAADAHSLFEAVAPLLQIHVRTRRAALFSLNPQSSTLTLEADAISLGPHIEQATTSDTIDIFRTLAKQCSEENEVVLCPTKIEHPEPADGAAIYWSIVAVPVQTASGQLIGVLVCEKEPTKQTRRSFSKPDIRSISAFARGVAPYLDRFLRLRASSTLVNALKSISRIWSEPRPLAEALQGSIETVVSTLNADLGSIFLREHQGEMAGHFILRAATGPMKKLVGVANYLPGEGLTGVAAQGTLLYFRTWAERQLHPKRKAKYEAEIWGDDHTPGGAYLAIPIELRDHVIGVWKVENIQPTAAHPDPYFTDEDVHVAKMISTFLAYAIDDRRYQDAATRDLTLLARSTTKIATAESEDDAILEVMQALEDGSLPPALLSLYDDTSQTIRAHSASGDPWRGIVGEVLAQLDSNNILAIALKRDLPFLIPDSTRDPRCDPATIRKTGIRAQFVVPVRLESELIGTLQLDLGDRDIVDEYTSLLLNAFTSHLAISISGIRARRRATQVSNQVLASARFVAAEALAALALHSVGHTVSDGIRITKDILQRKEVKERGKVYDILEEYSQKLTKSSDNIKDALELIKAQRDDLKRTDAHLAIQSAVDTWHMLLSSQRCSIRKHLRASPSECSIAAHALREILSILIVNAVQAHARQIEIITDTVDRIDTPPTGHRVFSALLLEFKDDGDGLATNQHEEIFAPDYTTKPKEVGTGLGLYIARMLARNASGEIWVDASARRGTTFILALPLAARG